MVNLEVIKAELTRCLNQYVNDKGITHSINWEARNETQIVSQSFFSDSKDEMSTIADELNHSNMFLKVFIAKARNRETLPPAFRVVIDLQNVHHLIENFRYAHYFNCLLKTLPDLPIYCLPSSTHNELHLTITKPNINQQLIINLLSILKISNTALSADTVAISSESICSIATAQKSLSVDYLVALLEKTDPNIKFHTISPNASAFRDSKHGIYLIQSNDVWGCPGVAVDSKNTFKMLNQIHPSLKVKENGYLSVFPEAAKSYGIKLNSIFEVPLFIENLTWADVYKARSRYVDKLITFKNRSNHYEFPSLPSEITKLILSFTCENDALFTEEEKTDLIDKIEIYKF
jgi:hypothetical protein